MTRRVSHSMAIRSIRWKPVVALAGSVLVALVIALLSRGGSPEQSGRPGRPSGMSLDAPIDPGSVGAGERGEAGSPLPAVASSGFRIDGTAFVSPRGERFELSPEESTDDRSQAEMAWLLRNGYLPASYLASKALEQFDPEMRLESIDVIDGLDFDEMWLLRSAAISADPARATEAQALLLEAATFGGSIAALEVLANAYAFGVRPDPVVSEAYTVAAFLRGHVHGGIGSGANAALELAPDQRRAASHLALQLLDRMNAERARAGLPPLQTDRRPGPVVPSPSVPDLRP
ncbi:MAG: hypothetical protein KatS3mg127_1439 [Silanimonas sp.]|jgi:hypothetical protein|nr:MAG: hypothetical protein KatS3mg127_1439 [Silanimonas sp.]